jgi:hypothetical protein
MAGEMPRGALPSITGVKERQARKVAAALLGAGMLFSEHHLAPLRIAFPVASNGEGRLKND